MAKAWRRGMHDELTLFVRGFAVIGLAFAKDKGIVFGEELAVEQALVVTLREVRRQRNEGETAKDVGDGDGETHGEHNDLIVRTNMTR
ncbi:hypothetical protein M422DRAFT_250274 [Sphaerobolus stellatus SS14]|uniref:Uncharacterized protein n=1 Tax=Sphaerobolus stellatus (strain SS14) TaxID=990650 RepID=A0A0C9VU85_SPHS4|nr:hypothetical protein M422DRAFT_250274 [Sphaerobolus stellatus SS14]